MALVVSINAASNVTIYGNPLGAHIVGNRVPFILWIRTRMPILYSLFMKSLAPKLIEATSGISAVLAFLPARIHRVGENWRTISLWIFVLSVGFIAAQTYGYGDPFEGTLYNHSLLACSPFLFLVFFLPQEEDKPLKFLRLLTIGYLIATAIVCVPQAVVAAHWGPRIFMGFMPVIGVVAFYSAIKYVNNFRGNLIRIAMLLLILVSIANQLYSLKLLYLRKTNLRFSNVKLPAWELSPSLLTDGLFLLIWLLGMMSSLYGYQKVQVTSSLFLNYLNNKKKSTY